MKPLPKIKTRRRCVFVTDEMWRAVAAAAKREDRSVASWIRQAILAAMGLVAPK